MSKPPQKPPPSPPAAPDAEPDFPAQALTGPQQSKGQARLRETAQKAARAADQGDDRAIRAIAEAIRRLLRSD